MSSVVCSHSPHGIHAPLPHCMVQLSFGSTAVLVSVGFFLLDFDRAYDFSVLVLMELHPTYCNYYPHLSAITNVFVVDDRAGDKS